MKLLRGIFITQSIVSILFGFFLVINSKTNLIGNVVLSNYTSNIQSNASLFFGAFFLLGGLLLLVLDVKSEKIKKINQL